MATTTLTGAERSTGRLTLVASGGSNNVDIVNAPAQWTEVEVISYGQDDLFVRVDGVAPIVDGKFAYVLPAGSVSVRTISVPTAGATKVQLISPGATKYVVQGTIGR